MMMGVIDKLDDKYEEMWDGEPVNIDIADVFFKENDGLFAVSDNRAIGMHPDGDSIIITIFELHDREDGHEIVCEDAISLVVDNRVEHRLEEMMKNTGDIEGGMDMLVGSDGSDEANRDNGALGYIG